MLKCSICGKEYSDVADRARCELSCIELNKKRQQEARENERKKAAKDIQHDFCKLLEKIKVYNKTYGKNVIFTNPYETLFNEFRL